jgi:hypothetical protein
MGSTPVAEIRRWPGCPFIEEAGFNYIIEYRSMKNTSIGGLSIDAQRKTSNSPASHRGPSRKRH